MAEGLRGNLQQLPLLDILRMLSMSSRSGRLDITQPGKNGEIYLENGIIVHSVTGSQIGEKGVYVLMGWMEGEFVFTPDVPSPERSIGTTTEQLLLEAARQAEQWGDIKDVVPSTDAVYNISPSGSTNTVSLKPLEWQVLAQVNGERSILEIGDILALPEFEVARIIYNLTTAGLLNEVADAKTTFRNIVDEAFFEKLSKAYTEVIGPLGPVIIEDEIKMLGEDRNAFPQDKASELVERVSLEIVDPKKRAQFLKEMVAVLRG
jgi:hypothetical protein